MIEVQAYHFESAYHSDCILLTVDTDMIASAGDLAVCVHPQRLTGLDGKAVCTIGINPLETKVLSLESRGQCKQDQQF